VKKVSIGNVYAVDWGKAAAFIFLVTAIFAVSCLSPPRDDNADQRFYGYFLRDVQAMQDMKLPVYWLGRDFTAGGLTFYGPYGVEFGGEVEGGGIFMTYVLWLEGTPFEGANTGLDITVYSPSAWEGVKDRITNPHPLPGQGKVNRSTVDVQGHSAQLISFVGGIRPVERLTLILQRQQVIVVAVAASVGPATPGGPDYNPFVNNPDLLVQVLNDNLRQYPQ
jgi:hypothetical protein